MRWPTPVLACVAASLFACGDGRGQMDGVETTTANPTETGDDDDAADDGEGDERYDVGDDGGQGSADDGGGDCNCGDAGLEFSYIWISNTEQGTVSKIDTSTMIEQGRYRTRPDGQGNPSRTSVTVSGRAAAVANRYGGVVKLHARPEDCVESNGVPGIQTSTGAEDVLSWGQEECVDWYTPFPEFTTQRPVAWTAGQLDGLSCTYYDEKLWTSGCGGGMYPGYGGEGGIDVHLLDGATGAREDSVDIDDVQCSPVGAYGGGVDADGNFWFNLVGGGEAHLGVVERDGLGYRLFDLPQGVYSYGMTVDAQGRPWVSSIHDNGYVVARFDPKTETWATSNDPGYQSEGGMQQDAEGRMWVGLRGANAGLAAYDVETLARVDWVGLDDSIKGVSIDADGFVWGVSPSTAYRLDPNTRDLRAYDQLENPYTYSDMTGWGLFQSACPTPEG